MKTAFLSSQSSSKNPFGNALRQTILFEHVVLSVHRNHRNQRNRSTPNVGFLGVDATSSSVPQPAECQSLSSKSSSKPKVGPGFSDSSPRIASELPNLNPAGWPAERAS